MFLDLRLVLHLVLFVTFSGDTSNRFVPCVLVEKDGLKRESHIGTEDSAEHSQACDINQANKRKKQGRGRGKGMTRKKN